MIPVIIINGPLGSGKTTLIHSLLSNCLDAQNTLWVKTEFGDNSIDEYLLQDTKVQTRSLTGGCICHVLLSKFGDLLSQIESEIAIDKIIVETSGMSHPQPVIQIIKQHAYFSVAHIALIVDTQHAAEPSYPKPSSFLADKLPYDVVIFNKYPKNINNSQELNISKILDPWFFENMRDIDKIYSYDIFASQGDYKRSVAEWCAIISKDVKGVFNENPQNILSSSKELDFEQAEDHEGDMDTVVFHFDKDKHISKEELESYVAKLPKDVIRIKGVLKIDNNWEFFNWVRGHGNWFSLSQGANGQLLILMGQGIKEIKNLHNI